MTRDRDEDPDDTHDEIPDRAVNPSSDQSRDGNSELDAREVDERFAALIADLDDSPVWSDDEEDDPPPPPRDDAAARRAHPSSGEPSLLDLWDAPIPKSDDDDDEDEYVPPPAPPVPRPSAPAVLGVLLIIGGLILMINPELIPIKAALSQFLGFVGFGGGVVMLVQRLRPEPDEDDSDDGAVL